MGLSVVEYRPEPKEAVKVVFGGEFFTCTPIAEFNRELALALFGGGVKVGILNHGPRDLDPAIDGRLKLLEQLEKNLPRNPDFYLCWEEENEEIKIGLARTPVFRLLKKPLTDGNSEYTCLVTTELPNHSPPKIAQILKERMEGLRAKTLQYSISTPDFKTCFFVAPAKPELVEETRSSLRFTGPGFTPQFLSWEEVYDIASESWLLLVEEGERLSLEDREAFEKVFFGPEKKAVFLEAVPLDGWGLENLIIPSVRFLRGRAVQDLTLPLDRLPLSCQGRWAPVRIVRSRFLAQKRLERMRSGCAAELPAYHYYHILAVDAVAAGKIQEAIPAFQKAYQEAPEPYRALVLRNLTLTLLHCGRYEEAGAILRDGRKVYPAYVDLTYLTGLALWKQKCYQEALQEGFRAAEKGEATLWFLSDPGSGSYKPAFLVGEVYQKRAEINDAVTAYIGSLSHNPYFLPALERLVQMKLDPDTKEKISAFLSQILDLQEPTVEAMFSQQNLSRRKVSKEFQFRGESHFYFHHPYNRTYENERAVEVPIVWRIVQEFQGKMILEVGNVLSHYFPVKHEVLDKYERAPGVLNQDVVDFKARGKYDLIVSISTLEHVGWDEEPREPEKILGAVAVLKEALAQGGKMVVTLPVGYNPEMDKMLADGRLSFTECYGLKRVSAVNEWVEVPWQEVLGLEYGKPYPYANGLVIGIIEK